MASDLARPITPHFEAAYGVRIGNPKRPAADDKCVMLALRLFLSHGIACCAQRNWPVRLTASVRVQSDNSTSSQAAVGPAMPALLTSASSPPNADVAVSNRRTTAAESATSHTFDVSWGSLDATARSACSSMSQMTTRAPSRTNARAVARPMPDAPAVTSTRKPSSFRSIVVLPDDRRLG